MRRVLLFSILLVVGLAGSQIFPNALGSAFHGVATAIQLLTMAALGFIMIHVGYEFEIDRTRIRSYAVDYGVAGTAAALPWLLCALYFAFVMAPADAPPDFGLWKQALLAGLFAAPTSAGILFSMLAAAGLSQTWLFQKARVLAIFDDLQTVLLMIPLKMMIVGLRWQLAVIVVVMAGLLAFGWRYLHRIRLPVTWPWVLGYSGAIALASEAIYRASRIIDGTLPVHIEVLLPAFILGCVLARPAGQDPHRDDAREGHQEGPESGAEQRVATAVSAAFMILVGLSIPVLSLQGASGAGALALHTLALTLLANAGKMFPILCYRQEAKRRERLALCIGMWPRGEVGAGVLVVSLSYGISGAMITAATLSLALNLLCTGLFILIVKRLLRGDREMTNSSRNGLARR